jgi:CheY-like chemotaxis protein
MARWLHRVRAGAARAGWSALEKARAGNEPMGIWGSRVVAVDEDLDVLEQLGTILRAHGCQLVAVSAPGEALATVVGVMPDVLLVGVSGDQGLALIRKVRTLSPEKGGRIPAATISACPPTAERIEDWRHAGFQRHVSSPLVAEQLVAVVEELAGRFVERRTNTLDAAGWPLHVRRERRCECRDGLTC